MSLNKVLIYIPDRLEQFLPEIEYVCAQISRYLQLPFGVSKDPQACLLSYGDDQGDVVIHENFFSTHCCVSEKGIELKNPAKLPLGKLEQFRGIEFFSLFSSPELPIVDNVSGKVRINFDLLGSIFFQLSRIEERNASDLDKHGRFKISNTLAYKSGFIKRPEVNFQLEVLKIILEEKGLEIRTEKRTSVHLTHDVDRLKSYHSFYQLFRETVGDVLKRRKSLSRGLSYFFNNLFSNEPQKSFHYLMDMSEKYKQKSTFFFISEGKVTQDATYVDKFRSDFLKMIELIKTRGHKIGIHPGYMTYDDFSELKAQLLKLEKITNEKIIYCRQHVLRWNPETPDLQNRLGLKEDYTLAFPYGTSFRSGTTFAFNAYSFSTRSTLDILLFPTSIMEFALFMDKYAQLSKSEAYREIRENVSFYRRFGGDLVVLFHTVIVNDFREEYEETLRLIFDDLK